jgi:S1-C subfamily serine protease
LINQGTRAIAIGRQAGENTQGQLAIAIGDSAGNINQLSGAIAIGYQAGQTNQGTNSISIGIQAGQSQQFFGAVAVGHVAGGNNQGTYATAVGYFAGQSFQKEGATAVGFEAGKGTQGSYAVAIGYQAGQTNQGQQSISIGQNAGQGTQGTFAIAIGYQGGQNTQQQQAISIGYQAGQFTQGTNGIAIGFQAGNSNQNQNAIAIGRNAGEVTQGNSGVAIGTNAGNSTQGANSIAIGQNAGQTSQGANSIAIGELAGQSAQGANTIVINATGVAVNTTGANRCHIAPIRNAAIQNPVYWNSTTSELIYNASTNSLKNNIQPLSLSNIDTSVIYNLSPKTFYYNSDPDGGKQIGYIAEDVHELDTNLTIYEVPNGEPKNVNFNNINVYTIEEVKKLREHINNNITSISNISSQVISLSSNNQTISYDIFNKLKKSTSQIAFVLNDGYYIGSGWFYYENTNDLKNGYFITAAHCVMLIENDVYYKTTDVYIHNPITNDWTKIDINNIYIDGIADIALIKTNIDLTGNQDCCLKVSTIETNAGENCYIVGNPGGFDEDSISIGCVRDPHYMETGGYQITDCIHVTAPGIGGNSGGPIVNILGDVIGIYTFGLGGDIESFGGGSNRVTLLNTLSVLKTLQDNKSKLYLGLDWSLPNPFLLMNYYNNQNSFTSKGVYIHSVSNNSPFFEILDPSDILLSATISVTNEMIDFGNLDTQRTPGVLIYYPINTVISITYIKTDKIQRTTNITLNKTYENVSNLLDGPLQTGLNERVGLNINRIQMKRYI